MSLSKDTKYIANHFGKSKQRLKLYEEVNELMEAVQYGCRKNILDEMADVIIMIKQHMHFNKITDDDLQERIEFKIVRTLDRIKTGYYEKQ